MHTFRCKPVDEILEFDQSGFKLSSVMFLGFCLFWSTRTYMYLEVCGWNHKMSETPLDFPRD